MDPLQYLLTLEKFGMNFGLANIRTLCTALGSPTEMPAALVAGTNGKGRDRHGRLRPSRRRYQGEPLYVAAPGFGWKAIRHWRGASRHTTLVARSKNKGMSIVCWVMGPSTHRRHF